MDKSKEYLIEKLLKEGKISQDDAYLLRREEKGVVYLTPPEPNRFIKQVPGIYPAQQPNPYKQNDWITDEMNRRAKIAENCPCNPANGGSGLCGCTLASPVITC
jgi:hypothetical protein